MRNPILPLVLACILQSSPASGGQQTHPGPVLTPYPTLENLAVEWLIEGDDNLNGVVRVEYRKAGDSVWREGMALRRVRAGENVDFSWANKHSGSVFNLAPNTLYEIKLNLHDPDGGDAERIVEVATRPEPVVPEGAEIIDLPPGTHGTLIAGSGTRGRPKVYRCSKGTATYNRIDLRDSQWVYLEGLSVVNHPAVLVEDEGVGIQMDGASNCVIRRCTIDAVYGIVADKPGALNCFFSDNVITGVSVWTDEAMGSEGDNIGEGIQITGSGNVICYNRVTGFRDCISTMEGSRATSQVCFDIYNNDVYRGVDDGIEADFCMSNCRIYRNRLTNCYVGLSSQPGLGGPTYFVRNVMYNVVHGAFKLKRFSQGDVVLHNTVIKVGTGLGGNEPMDHAFFRNNLAIGGPDGGVKWGGYGAGKPWAANILDPGEHSSFDYDAVGVYGTPYVAEVGGRPFSMVEIHGVERIELEDTFQDVAFPNPPVPEKDVPDLRLKPGSRAIDAGLPIPNINGDFSGKAPDCGAYEFGRELPHYGPRPG